MRLFTLASCTCLFIALMSFNAYSENMNNGASLYKKCISCHRADASGKGLNKMSQAQIVQGIHAIKDNPNTKLKKMRDIFVTYSDDDIKDIAHYINSLKKM